MIPYSCFHTHEGYDFGMFMPSDIFAQSACLLVCLLVCIKLLQ